MNRREKFEKWATDVAVQYGLYQRLGVDSSLWYLLDDLKFRQRRSTPQVWTWEDRPSGVASWRPRSNSVETLVETVWSRSNAPWYRYVTRDGHVPSKQTLSAFESWAYSFANSRGVGGAFLMMRSGFTHQRFAEVNTNTYRGKLGIQAVWSSSPVQVPATDRSSTSVSFLNGLGATAISRVLPNNPSSNLANFLGEMRERLPSAPLLSLYRDRTHNLLKNSGGEYLNYQFGWRPLVKDLRGFAHQAKIHERTLRTFLKNQERRLSRSYQFPKTETVNTYSGVRFITGSSVTGFAFVDGNAEVTETIERWFVGQFQYYLPGGSSALEKAELFSAKADALLGVDLTPEIVYNLTPWTWMLDWFVNLGDIMTNISNLGQDGTVLRYGYIMEHRKVVKKYTATFQGQALESRFEFETKRRLPASPYGFGLTAESLTPSQWAILAALGFTKTGR